MKNAAIGFAIGIAAAFLSVILGAMANTNGLLLTSGDNIPVALAIIGLMLKGFAAIFLFAFLLGLVVVTINWGITQTLMRKKRH